ncbi:MAG: GNAT family N-acetyltransferase [Acidimicrobiia bacterium]
MSRRYSDVEELTASHELAEFDCGSDTQNEWLRNHALQAHRSGTSRVYVVRRLADDRVVGFHALATGSVRPQVVPERVRHGTGRYDIPVIILTRLGVDRSEQRQGLGRALVVHALRQVVTAANIVGVRALLIHAEDEPARAFYERLAEFNESPTDPLHLYLLLKDIRHALA